ncbi:hypothetical protein KBD59_04075 [Candidatus Gracilibacteria bacterium]|nr:hypothetical protein [Candidatus Gracilibacteria bacterium]
MPQNEVISPAPPGGMAEKRVTSYTLPETMNQQSPGVLCVATTVEEKFFSVVRGVVGDATGVAVVVVCCEAMYPPASADSPIKNITSAIVTIFFVIYF